MAAIGTLPLRHPGADNPLVPRRQRVRTYLFADLRDSTPFVETRGDAAAVRVLTAYRRIVRAAVAARSGAEIKTEGDSFYVVFESPAEAIGAALAILRRIAAHNARHAEERIQAAIGINTGEAIEHDGGYVGSNVIIAQRLCAQARAGQILVTDTVRALVRSRGIAPMREVGMWHLKGIVDAIRVHEIETGPSSVKRSLGPGLQMPAILMAVPHDEANALVVCPDLVQRERPLAALASQLEAAAKGAMRVVVLSGEGGVGKSRLCRELAERAESQGFYVLGGRSHGAGDAPYEPFVAALRPYARGRGAEILRRSLGGLAPELGRLLPELDLPLIARDAGIPDEEQRDRFLRTVQLLLEDAASLRPVLLVLEDFQQSDTATQDLLRYLTTTLRASVCIVCTVRDEDVAAGLPLYQLLSDLDRERRLTRVELAPLDLAGVARMVEALVPSLADDALVRALFERTEGVPFYVEELLKTALDEPASASGLALPRTVRDSVQLRVARLVEERGQGVADLLEALSIAAVPLDREVIERVASGDAADAGADIDAAVSAQLLERAPTRTDIYRFRHALTREAVEDGIPGARRRRLAASVAAAIESTGARDEDAPLLARLFASANDRPQALRYARAGAAGATRVGAYATAIQLLEEASEHARGIPEEAAVLEELAIALQAAGRAGEAEVCVGRARAIVGDTGDDARIARLDVRLASVLRMQGRRMEAIAAVKRAVRRLEGSEGPELAQAVVTHAALAWAESDAKGAAELASQALSLAERCGDSRVRVNALTVLGAALSRLGETSGRERLEQAIGLGRSEGHVAEVANAYLELSRALQALGDWEGSRGAAQEGIALAQTHGLEFAQANLLTQVASALFTQGRYREARAASERAVALARPDTVAAASARARLARTLTMLGEHAAALALVDQLDEWLPRADPDHRALVLGTRAYAILGLGKLDEAWEAARAALDVAHADAPYAGTVFLIATDVLEARRDAAGLRSLIEDFDRKFAGRNAAPARVLRAEMEAALDLCLGTGTSSSFRAVADGYDAIGVRVRALYRRATSIVLEGAGTADVADRLARVRTELVDRGAMRYVAAIDVASRGATASTPSTYLLNDEELRLALLVARGLTNGRIAAELGVTTASIARSVRALLEKLGVTRRSQLATWAVWREGLNVSMPVE